MRKLIENNLSKQHFSKSPVFSSNSNNIFKQDCVDTNAKDAIKNNQEKGKALKQKYQAQQVSVLYSEHIYKTTQRDFILEAQLQKCKNMLQSQKKKKMKLIAEQREWKLQKQKLMQEKKIILFALDSLSVKLQADQTKKNNELHKQTVELLKSKFQTSEQESRSKHVETKFKSQKQYFEYENQISSNSSTDKLSLIRSLKRKIKLNMTTESKSKSSECQQVQQTQEIEEAPGLVDNQCGDLQFLKQQMESYQQKINNLNDQLNELKNKLIEQQRKSQQPNLKIIQSQTNLTKEKQRNTELTIKIDNLITNEIQMRKQLNLKQERVETLEKQLRLTLESYQQRQQKQKQHIQNLQKFTKQLKLSDEKIQQFLKTQFGFGQENRDDLCGVKKTYHEHISYILHLCKKKQALYEHLIDDLKQKMKQDGFRMTILEKKLSNFSKYHEELRYQVQNQSNKDVVYRAILRFGH